MSRIITNFPWVWNSLTGVQPSYKLDDDYNAVPEGSITIRTQVLAADYTLVADDDYSCFLCLPTANMSLFLPSSPGPSFSFFITNQSATKTVQIFGTISINGAVPVLNPILTPGALVTGGLVVWDGSSWSLYSQFSGVSPGAGVTSISKTGSPALIGNVTLSQGSNVTLTQVGQDISIAASGSSGTGTVTSVGLLGTANQIAVAGATPITASGTFTLSIPANAQLSVAKLTNLTSNGFVKTNSADGTLSVDGNTYILAGGNAGTATALQTARNINGVAFDGTANITVTAAGSTLSDTVTVAKGGTGLTALGSALQVLRVNAGGTALEYATAAASGVTSIAGTANQITASASTGAVTLSIPTGAQLNIAKIVNLTTNGLVTTSAGDGTLGITVPGTGVLTALAVNVGSAGAFVTFNGALGTPSSGTLTSATGLPISTGVSGLGTNVAAFLATPSSANLASALTDKTGTGVNVFATSPTLVTPTSDSLTISGNQSVAAWTTNGVRLKSVAGTLTDTSSSGTVAAAYTNVLGGNTIAASSATTFTDYYSMFLKDPIAGTNVTLTNKWALGAESLKVTGSATFAGNVGIGVVASASIPLSVFSASATTLARFDGTGASFPGYEVKGGTAGGGVDGLRLINDGATNRFNIGLAGSTNTGVGGGAGNLFIYDVNANAVRFAMFSNAGTCKILPPNGSGVVTFNGQTNTSLFSATGYSSTGSNTVELAKLSGTLNNGSTVQDVFSLAITNAATGAASKLMNLYAGAGGATSKFSVDVSGNVIHAGSLDISAIAAGSPNFIITKTTDTPTTTWTAGATVTNPSGFIEITEGGTSKYIPFYA